jgi:hypothetical protein
MEYAPFELSAPIFTLEVNWRQAPGNLLICYPMQSVGSADGVTPFTAVPFELEVRAMPDWRVFASTAQTSASEPATDDRTTFFAGKR